MMTALMSAKVSQTPMPPIAATHQLVHAQTLLSTGLDRPSLMLYPIFLVVADSALVGLILLRRRTLEQAASA